MSRRGTLNKATQAMLTDTHAVGMTYWGDAPSQGSLWATDDSGDYHAVWAGNRGGKRQSRHACGLLRGKLYARIDKLAGTAYVGLARSDWENEYRQREVGRIRHALWATPGWRCQVDGPTVEHPAVCAEAVEQFTPTEPEPSLF